MLNNLNFKHIFYFYIVARESSIRKASIILNISPSSISEQIKLLEYRSGVDFFDRGQKKMILTSQGKVLYETLHEFFPRIEELFESLINHKSTNVKFLRIGVSPTLSTDMRYELCFPFIEDSQYTVKILQGENQFLFDAFNRDEVDLLFTTNANFTVMGKYERHKMIDQHYVIVANKKIYSQMDPHSPYEILNGLKYINYTPDSDLHFDFFNIIYNKKIAAIRIAEIDDIRLIKNTIQQIDCFSILPLSSARKELSEKKIFQIGPEIDNISGHITGIYKPKFHSERFTQHLKNIAEKLKQF